MNLETIAGAYSRGQLVTCVLMGASTFVLLTACGVENALALAVIAGLADVPPCIGPLSSMGPAVRAALPHGPGITTRVFVLMAVYEEVESRVLVPRIDGRAPRGEEEYERRTDGVGSRRAAGIAAGISLDRPREEALPAPDAAGPTGAREFSDGRAGRPEKGAGPGSTGPARAVRRPSRS